MPQVAGTIERIALDLGKALQSLQEILKPDIFNRLGVELPAVIAGDANLNAQLTATETTITGLIARIQALETAINNDDAGAITSSIVAVIAGIKKAISNFKDLGDALKTAAGTLPPADKTALQQLAQELVSRLLQFAIVGFLNDSMPVLTNALTLVGIMDKEPEFPPGLDEHSLPTVIIPRRIYFDRITNLFSNPVQYFKDTMNWGNPAFDGTILLQKVQALIEAAGVPADLFTVGAQPLTLEAYLFTIQLDTTVSPPGLKINFNTASVNDFDETFPLSDLWKSTIHLHAAFDFGLAASFRPPLSLTIKPPTGNVDLGFLAGIKAEKSNGDPIIILGETGGSRLQSKNISASLGLDAQLGTSGGDVSPAFQFSIDEGKLIIDTSKGDGFLQKILPAIKAEADFTMGGSWDAQHGFQFRGSSALEISFPVHISLGPVSIEGLTIDVKFKDGTIPVSLGADIKAALGPLVAVVQNIGMTGTFSFPSDNSGNLGPIQLDLGFKPPNGVGLSIDTGIIKGGGFLFIDVDKGEYVGAIELDFIGVISLKAIGIINTIMPDGSKGFSMLIIITADFPPIQLGFGFTLNAVGGLLGLNRTVKIDVLREGVKTNAIKSILFPQDIIANITRIVSDIKQVFPPYPDHFVVGPMAELGWGTPSILTLEIGILLEIPVPRIAILGVIKAFLPTEDVALLRIQVNFLGVIDFQNKYISFDASLFDSRLLIYTLAGDMAFRLSWGDDPMFILSVGGFHPAYHDAPADLQHMTRLTISLLSGDNPRISVQSYFAVTSNTVQFGAKAELYAAAAGFNVYGFIGYDVLFRFDPFKFIADFSAGLALRRGDSVVMGISLSGELSGPSPFNAKGDASIDFFFFSISVSFNETWGDSDTNDQPEKINIIPLLTAELQDDRNWKAVIPDYNHLHVSVKKLDLPPDKIVIHPFGVLTFSQRLVPLDVTISKFGNKVPDGASLFTIKESDADIHTTVARELFAPANFFDKSDNEKLSSPSFEQMDSGFQLTGAADLNMPIGVLRNVDYELSYLHKAQSKLIFAGVYKYAKALFKSALKGSAASNSKLSFTRNKISANAPDKVTVLPGQFAVANVSDMKLYQSDMVSGSYTEAKQQYDTLIQTHPEMKDQVQILSHFELNMN